MFELADHWAVSPDVKSVVTRDGAFLLDVARGRCYRLNRTASRIWQSISLGAGCEPPLDVAQVEDMPDDRLNEAEVTEFLVKLAQRGFITARPQTSGERAFDGHLHPQLTWSTARAWRVATVPVIGILAASAALAAADIILRVRGFNALHRLVTNCKTRHNSSIACQDTVDAVVSTVRTAAKLYFGNSACLPRTAATVWLLRLSGVRAEMIIGCRMLPFYAHAWTEVDGSVVDDPVGLQKVYAVVDRW